MEDVLPAIPAAKEHSSGCAGRPATAPRRTSPPAAVLGIPASTYARYERQPEGPECAIPLSSAWQIADALGCSIDLVVGREDIDAASAPTLDERAAALSLNGQEVLRGFLGYLEQLDAAKAVPRRPVV